MKIWGLLLLLVLMLAAAACADAGLSVLPAAERPADEQAQLEACADPAEGQRRVIDSANGLCFLYPERYDLFQGEDGSLTLYVRSLLNTEAPVATLHFEAADGRSVDDASAQILVNYALPEGAVQPATLGGAPAIVMDGLPGQDANRRIMAVHDDRLIDLMVARIGDDYGPVGREAEALYDQIVDSMTFIEPEAGGALAIAPECPQAGENTALYRDDSDGFCFLLPGAYAINETQVAENGARDTAFYQDSLLDVSHARLFVTVEDAAGRSLEEVTAEKVAEVTAIMPDAQPMGSFGYMVDGVPANQFDQAPGQDLSRQLFFVHNGRLFTLTFIPDDPAAGAAYEEMQALYNTVVESFSLLNQ